MRLRSTVSGLYFIDVSHYISVVKLRGYGIEIDKTFYQGFTYLLSCKREQAIKDANFIAAYYSLPLRVEL